MPVQVRCTILDAWGWCTGMTQRDGMGREEGSGWGTHVYLWQIHFDIWQNQYNIVKFKNKIKKKKNTNKQPDEEIHRVKCPEYRTFCPCRVWGAPPYWHIDVFLFTKLEAPQTL